MIYLRQSTASQEISLGYFLDSTDGNTEETGLTINNTDIQLWKNGATTLANKNSGGATHISNGLYYAVLDATDTDTLGAMRIHVHVAGALAVIRDCVVLSANIYDSWIVGTDNLQVDTIQISGDGTAADNLELDYDGTGYAKANSTIGTTTTNTDMRGTDSALLATNVNVSAGVVESNVKQISDDATAADNLELQYDTTGLDGENFPAQQHQVDNLSIGSSGIHTTATTAVITTGSQTLTYTATQQRDGTFHEIADAAGTTDLYYQFSVGATGVPSAVTLFGRVFNNGDSLNIFGYNWGTTTWEQIGTLTGKNQVTSDEITLSMYNTHVGSGANAGLVRVRFQNTGLTSSVLHIDQLYVSYAVVASPVGYSGGKIWVDTINGTAGAVTGVNGVADLPVLTWADALIISTNIGLKSFNIANGSTITLSGDSSNLNLTGSNWTLALASQIITNLHVVGASITGIGTGIGSDFHDCTLAAGASLTVAGGDYFGCAIAGDIILTGATTYYFDQCFSGVAGTSTPSIDFGASVVNTNVNFRHYSGGIEVKNIGQTGIDNISLEGLGQLILNANCTSGTIAIRGNFTITDNVVGGFVVGGGIISDDARFDVTQIDDTINSNSDINNIDTGVNNIEAKLPTNFIMGSAVQTAKDDEIDAILVDTGTTIPAAISSSEAAIRGADSDDLKDVSDQVDALQDISAANVNAEVLDVLNVDTFAKPGQEAPADTQTLIKMVAYLYKALVNRFEQTSSGFELYDNAGTTVDQKAIVSDDATTYIRQEIVSGP